MKTNTLLLIIVALLMSLVTTEARDIKQNKVAVAAPAPAQKAPGFLRRLFTREKPKAAPQVQTPSAVVRPKPKPNLAETSAARRSQGQRPDPKRSATKAVSATASAKVAPSRSAPKVTPPASPEKPSNVLAKAPARAPVDTSAIQKAYSSNSVLGRAMRRLWSTLSGEATRPTTVEQKLLPRVRVTAYHNDDADSAARRSSTQVKLRPATPTQIGVAAGPAELLGSYAIVEKDGVELRYLIADTGSAVEKKTASDGKAPVIDLYEPRQKGESVEDWQDWESYQPVRIVQIKGAAHMLLQEKSDRDEFLRLEVFERALSLSARG